MSYIKTDERIYNKKELNVGEVAGKKCYIDTNLNIIFKEQILDEKESLFDLCQYLIVDYLDEPEPRLIKLSELMEALKLVEFDFNKHIRLVFESYGDRIRGFYLSSWTSKGLTYMVSIDKFGELHLVK